MMVSFLLSSILRTEETCKRDMSRFIMFSVAKLNKPFSWLTNEEETKQ